MPTRPAYRSFRTVIADVADLVAGAMVCASATEAGRQPSRAALAAVGIDHDAFRRIGRR